MTSRNLIKLLHERFSTFCDIWEGQNDSFQDIGFLVFDSIAFANAAGFDDLTYSFLTVKQVRKFLAEGRKSDSGVDVLLKNLNYGEEYLVMVIEHGSDPTEVVVEFRKIDQIRLN